MCKQIAEYIEFIFKNILQLKLNYVVYLHNKRIFTYALLY